MNHKYLLYTSINYTVLKKYIFKKNWTGNLIYIS